MKRTRNSTEQIISKLAEVQGSSAKISDACRVHNITAQTYYRWKRKYDGRGCPRVMPGGSVSWKKKMLGSSEWWPKKSSAIETLKEVDSKKS
jgi:hypothetical protein